MQQQNGMKANATSSTQNYAEETHNNDSLAETIPLENGMIIRRRDTKWFTTMGDTIITQPTDNYNGQLEQIDDLNYKVLINLMIHVHNTLTKHKDKMTETPYETESL